MSVKLHGYQSVQLESIRNLWISFICFGSNKITNRKATAKQNAKWLQGRRSTTTQQQNWPVSEPYKTTVHDSDQTVRNRLQVASQAAPQTRLSRSSLMHWSRSGRKSPGHHHVPSHHEHAQMLSRVHTGAWGYAHYWGTLLVVMMKYIQVGSPCNFNTFLWFSMWSGPQWVDHFGFHWPLSHLVLTELYNVCKDFRLENLVL